MEKLFVPSDNESSKRKPDGSGYFGVCGPSTIAVLTHKNVKEIINVWANGFKGYAPMKEMEATLKKLGCNTSVRKKGNKAKEFPEPTTDAAIIRVQWLKEDGTEFYWAAQTPNTHWVLMQKLNSDKSSNNYGKPDAEGVWWIFCNEYLWFKKDSEEAKKYLRLGYVSSYFEINTREKP